MLPLIKIRVNFLENRYRTDQLEYPTDIRNDRSQK
jgi:hypothetical protein